MTDEQKIREILLRQAQNGPTVQELGALLDSSSGSDKEEASVPRESRSRYRRKPLAAAAAVVAVVAAPLAFNAMQHNTPSSGEAAAAECDRAAVSLPGSTEDVGYLDSHCQVTNIGTPSADEYSPDLSSDGTKLVYVTRETDDGPTDFVVTSTDGSSRRVVLTSDILVGGPVWSPDGKAIAYWRGDGAETPSIWVLDIATGVQQRVTNLEDVTVQPDWSPDGKQLAFVAGSQVGRVSAQGGPVTMASAPGLTLKFPAWSPDGSQVAAVAEDEGLQRSAVVLINTRSMNVVTKPSFVAGEALGLRWGVGGPVISLPSTAAGKSKEVLLDPSTLQPVSTTQIPGIADQ